MALALRYVPFEKSRDLLLKIADGYDGKDRYYVEAFGIGCTDKEEKVYAALRKKHSGKKFDPKYAGLVWRLHPVSAVNELKGWAMDKDKDDAFRRSMLFAISLIEAPQAATAMVEIAKRPVAKPPSSHPYSSTSAIREFGTLQGQGSTLGQTRRADRLRRPARPVGIRAGNQVAQGIRDPFPQGRRQARQNPDRTLLVCHKIGSAGVEFGPALAGWGSGQTRDVILKAILDPSADISHGFEGTELIVKGDKKIQGFVQAEGDPLVIRVFGGQDLVIAKEDIQSRKQVKTSFMAPANRLGMDAQQLRDVVEYLKLN